MVEVKKSKVSTIFPRDTKMKISIQEDSITLDANEKKLFQILQKANGCVKVTAKLHLPLAKKIHGLSCI